VIRIASPLAGRGDAASTIDACATLVFPMGASTEASHLLPIECIPRIDGHPQSSHRRINVLFDLPHRTAPPKSKEEEKVE